MKRPNSHSVNKESRPPQSPVVGTRKEATVDSSQSKYPRFSFLGIALAWTLMVGLSLWWNESVRAQNLQAKALVAEANAMIWLWAGHGFLWLLGLVGLVGADYRLSLSWRQRDLVDQALQETNDRLQNMVHEYRRVNQEISLINDLTDQLHACFTYKEAFQIIVRLMPQFFPGFSGDILMLNASNNYLETKASWGTLPSDQSVIDPQSCWALRRGRAFQMQEPSRDILCDHLSHPLAAGYLCVPLVAHGETLGIFHLRAESPEGDAVSPPVFSEDLHRLVQTIADHLSLSLGNLKLQDVLRYQAIRDPLTGLYNRRFMLENLEREIFRMKRKGASMSIIMLDLDHFKSFNDTFGHSAGDDLLNAMGNLLLQYVRKEDIACRYGGEEFTLIFPETSLDTACARAEELRCKVEEFHPKYLGENLGSITVSMGVAAYPEHGSTPQALLKGADGALYEAKHLGRNRVVTASVDPREPV